MSNISLALPKRIEHHVAFFGSDSPGYRFAGHAHDFKLSGSGRLALTGRLLNAVRRLNALRQYVKKHTIETVVSFGESANLYNIAARHGASRVISIRSAIDEHWEAEGRYSSLYRRLVDVMYPRADQVVCVSQALAHRVADLWPALVMRTTIIHNLYHLEEIRTLAALPLPAEHAHLEGESYVLVVGSLVEPKGHNLLLEAFANKDLPNEARLVVMGSGPLRLALEQRATELGLTARCDFIDFDSNPYRYMARATVFVLPSRFEGFPNVLVEAMACGAPVVAFDCPTGPREILGASEHGLLVPALSVPSLAEAIGRLLRSPPERRRFAALALARSEDFGAGRIVHRWIELLAELQQRNGICPR